jgi:hypothetical protein
MSTILPYVYGFIPGVILGAIFGVLWGRKHPSTVEAVVAEGKQIGAAAQGIGKK